MVLKKVSTAAWVKLSKDIEHSMKMIGPGRTYYKAVAHIWKIFQLTFPNW